MRFLGVLFTFLCAALAASADSPAPMITVQGAGLAVAAPDMAALTLGAEANRRHADDAMDAVAQDMAAILAALREMGVDEADIQTTGLSLQPYWSSSTQSNPTRRIDGFSARNTVAVTLRDLDAVGGVINRMVDLGANSFRGVTFGLQDPEPVRDIARRDAVADAMRKAQLYADAAGLTLGPIQAISEGGAAVPQPVMTLEAARSMAADMPIAPGEISMQAIVSIQFRLQ